MHLDIPTKYNKNLYEKTISEILNLQDRNIFIKSQPDDYELISIMADGPALIKVIEIVLKNEIAE